MYRFLLLAALDAALLLLLDDGGGAEGGGGGPPRPSPPAIGSIIFGGCGKPTLGRPGPLLRLFPVPPGDPGIRSISPGGAPGKGGNGLMSGGVMLNPGDGLSPGLVGRIALFGLVGLGPLSDQGLEGFLKHMSDGDGVLGAP